MTLIAFLEYEKRVYEFCDKNIGEKVLFTSFCHLWPIKYSQGEKSHLDYLINSQELSIATSVVLKKLEEKGVVRALSDLDKTEDLEGWVNGYPYYEILPHEKLVDDSLYR
jgi:hypothetical protein